MQAVYSMQTRCAKLSKRITQLYEIEGHLLYSTMGPEFLSALQSRVLGLCGWDSDCLGRIREL